MVKNHLKTIAAPKTWPVKRKERIFIMRPEPGPHGIKEGITMNLLMTQLLKLTTKRKETTYLLNNKEVLVDGKRRKNAAFPVGLFDVISIKDINKNYRIIIDNRGRINAVETDDKMAGIKPCKIKGKNKVGKKIQLNLFDGKNILVEKGDYKVGDTIVLALANNEVKEHFKLEKGNLIFMTGGRHIGEIGKVEDIMENKIIYKIKSDEVHQTLKRYAFVIGKDEPVIKIGSS
jgi:small subunit ribosomal protein S4e